MVAFLGHLDGGEKFFKLVDVRVVVVGLMVMRVNMREVLVLFLDDFGHDEGQKEESKK